MLRIFALTTVCNLRPVVQTRILEGGSGPSVRMAHARSDWVELLGKGPTCGMTMD